MILFELRCGNEHHFEAWFKDGATYDAQAAAGEIACPTCGDARVGKAPMAPRLAKHHGVAADIRQALSELRKTVEANCEHVGDRFAEEARKIHYGEADARAIYGQASADEAKELADEGVEFTPIPWVPEGN